MQDLSVLEDKNMSEEKLPIANIHTMLPAATQEKSDFNEQLLEFQTSQKETDNYYAKTTSLPIADLVIKTSIEGGEPSIISTDV